MGDLRTIARPRAVGGATAKAPAPARGPVVAPSPHRLADVGVRAPVTEPGDAVEAEAEALAHRVLAAPASASVAPPPRGGPARAPDAGPATGLTADERRFFEPRFGLDLGSVRIHEGPRAAASARSVGARAYAVGRHVVLGEGTGRATTAGRSVLAHELAHVVQQRFGAAPPVVARLCLDGEEGALTPRVSNATLFWQIRKYHTGEIPPERQIREGGRRVSRERLLRAAECAVAELVWNGDLEAIDALLGTWNVDTDRQARSIVLRGRILLTSEGRGVELVDELARTRIWRRSGIGGPDVVAMQLLAVLGRSGALNRMIHHEREAERVLERVRHHFPAEVDRRVRTGFVHTANVVRRVQVRGPNTPLFVLPGAMLDGDGTRALLRFHQAGDRAVNAFAQGFQAELERGLTAARRRALAPRLAQAAALNLLFPAAFSSGVVVGIVQDAYENVRGLVHLFQNLGELARQLQTLVTRMLEDPEVARDFGRDVGRGMLGSLRELEATTNPITFTFTLGRLVGPLIAEALASLLGVSLVVAATRRAFRFTGAALRRASQFARAVRARRRRVRLPDPDRPSTPDVPTTVPDAPEAPAGPSAPAAVAEAVAETVETVEDAAPARRRRRHGREDREYDVSVNRLRPGSAIRHRIAQSAMLRPFADLLGEVLRGPTWIEIRRLARSLERAYRGTPRQRAGAVNVLKGYLQEAVLRQMSWFARVRASALARFQRLQLPEGTYEPEVLFTTRVRQRGALTDGLFFVRSADGSRILVLDVLEAKSARNWRALFTGRRAQIRRDIRRLLHETVEIDGRPYRHGDGSLQFLSDFGVDQPWTLSIPRHLANHPNVMQRLRAGAARPQVSGAMRSTFTVVEGPLPDRIARELARLILEHLHEAG